MGNNKCKNRLAGFFLVMLFAGCVDGSSEQGSGAASTIDSNTVNGGDSIPAILHLDNADDTTYPVALDSLGPTVDASDTSKRPR